MEGIAEIKKHTKIYYLVFLALIVGTIITVFASNLSFGVALGVTVALTIALVKGSLVAGYFMHLTSEKKTIYLVLFITALLFFALMFIMLGTVNDQVGEHLVP